ncbi:MAG: [FeFe] hydrogenase H-cluster radical SAM maturase HydG [Defluviitaleaceae bacterium]|nr:[FeFe] hydrogenase H-cluster radical SAM maturase HydG [Defluviitaleaceae bacterium]
MTNLNDAYINGLLQAAANIPDNDIENILAKAANFQGLTHQEAAALLMTQNEAYINHTFEIAGKIKKHIYGDRIVIFAPLYVSDHCINRCTYCGFRHDSGIARRKLTQDEIRAEVAVLEKMGHKRLAIEAGEDPSNCPLDYILECIDTIYNMKFENGEIRRVNINIAASSVKDYRRLKDAHIGTYILFQETYHRPTYEKVHPTGPKSDYDYHLTAFDRAMEAGIDDVGAGALFGLYDYKYETLALMLHNEHLENHFGVGFHTISVPRIRSTDGVSKYPHAVSDKDFLRLVAILRMAVPFTGMIVSSRETPEMRRQLIQIGISQMSAGSRTAVGGYSGLANAAQFSIADHRDAQEIIYWLMEEGTLPSFCTACYRQGRSGDRFMTLAKSGDIKNVCLPNGLLTLKEYALDYGDDRFSVLADALISKKLADIDSENTRHLIESKLIDLSHGKRDLFI